MTELQKMRNGSFADTSDSEILERLNRAKKLILQLNTTTCLHSDGYRSLLEELVPHLAESALITPPFFCDYGDNIVIGEHTFINFNCTFLDGAKIHIGSHVLIGPNVQIYTPRHPMDYMKRRDNIEKALPVTIGDDCWIGGGAIILPGVTIGARCVVGAGSVVTKDISVDTIVAGNPARPIKQS